MNYDDLFDQTCPSLSGVLAGEFYDGHAPTDEETARRVGPDPRTPDAADERVSMESLVEDCRTALENIEKFWKPISRGAGKDFSGPDETREWLTRMMRVWEKWLDAQEKASGRR